MIRMTAEIELLEGSGEIQTDTISITPSGNNISADLADIVGVRRAGSNPFLFGISKLGSGATFSSGENYFIGSQAADENGDFATPYVLTFSITPPQQQPLSSISVNFSIVFDTLNNAYPSTVTVSYYSPPFRGSTTTTLTSPYFVYNGTMFYNKEPIEFAVTMSDWSMPNYPLRIHGIYTGLYLYFDRRNLVSLSAPIKDRSDNEQPSYGIISNEGEMTVIDTTLEIKEYARMKLLTPDLDVQIWLEDTLTKKKQSIGKFKTNKWSYNNKNFEVTIQFKDDLEKLQEEKIKNDYSLFFTLTTNGYYTIEDVTSEYVFNNLKQYTEKYITVNSLTDEQKNYLQSIILKKYYMQSDSIWESWNKFCIITNCKIYEKNGSIFFNFN